MGIEVRWADAFRKILVWHFEGEWSADDLRMATRETQVISAEVEYNYALIFDPRRGITPRFPLAEAQRSFKVPVVRRDLMIVVSKDLFIRSLLTVLPRLGITSMGPEHYCVVATMDDALSQIQKRLAGNDPMYQAAVDSLSSNDDTFIQAYAHHQRK